MDVLWLGQQHFTGRAQPCSAFQLVQHEEEEKKKKAKISSYFHLFPQQKTTIVINPSLTLL